MKRGSNIHALLTIATMATAGHSILPSEVAPSYPHPFGSPSRPHRRGAQKAPKHAKQKARARRRLEKAGRKAAR